MSTLDAMTAKDPRSAAYEPLSNIVPLKLNERVLHVLMGKQYSSISQALFLCSVRDSKQLRSRMNIQFGVNMSQMGLDRAL